MPFPIAAIKLLAKTLDFWLFHVFRGVLGLVIELDLVMSLLKLTKGGAVLIEYVNKDAKLPPSVARRMLKKLQDEGIVYLKQKMVGADDFGRLELAVRAVSLGADVERVSNILRWQEFEGITAIALERNNFAVAKNVRFTHAGRRWEIDVVGCKEPLVVCVDCKHWHHGMSPSALEKIAQAQVERTRALSESLPNAKIEIECAKWSRAKFIPVVLSLITVSAKFYGMVPVVPVLQLQDFLTQLPACTESVKWFSREFNHLRHHL
jgi:Holliday junction resolvase-like predicted endonuclease